ncbi:hypothetical protein MWQ84_002376 [Staphylococcus pseudintermedius]|nr:hypothetical protein [Staphylococcus pseudintermedius]
MRTYKFFAVLMSLVLLISFLSEGVLYAKTFRSNVSNESEVEKNERILRVAFEEAAVYNPQKEELEFDEYALKEGLTPEEYNDLAPKLKRKGVLLSGSNSNIINYDVRPDWDKVFGKEKRTEFINKCTADELSATYGEKAAKAIAKLIVAKNYKKAAKELVKRGLKASNLVYNGGRIVGVCIYRANKKGL